MADRFLQRLRERAPHSAKLIGFASVVIILLLLVLTITSTVLGLILFAPLILISSPIWILIGVLVFVAIAGTLSFLGFGIGMVAALSWLFRGSGRLDYARTRFAKEYAASTSRGYSPPRVKDAAPGA